MSEFEDQAKLKAFREAAKVGLDAIAAGRHRSFDSTESLSDYFRKPCGRSHRPRAQMN
ncbi:MAG TPA: hypothetical protein VKV32_12575 [Stellaceae bacterium]|nr:hypothetical protein [Stellaceae bacterium]